MLDNKNRWLWIGVGIAFFIIIAGFVVSRFTASSQQKQEVAESRDGKCKERYNTIEIMSVRAFTNVKGDKGVFPRAFESFSGFEVSIPKIQCNGREYDTVFVEYVSLFSGQLLAPLTFKDEKYIAIKPHLRLSDERLYMIFDGISLVK